MKTHKNIQRIFALLLSITIAFGVMCVPVNVYAATTDVYTITYHLDGGTNALKNPSAYTAESFDGYSYSKATDSDGVGVSWQSVFAKRLSRWRKI